MNTPLRLSIAFVALSLVATACAPPPSAVRRSALVPMATAAVRTGRPLDAGEVRLGLNIERALTGTEPEGYLVDIPNEEDAGVYSPRTMAGGHVYVGIIDELEAGLSFNVGTMDSAEANFPEHVIAFDADPVVEVAFGVRGNIRIGDYFALSIIGQLGGVSFQQATYLCRHFDRIGGDTYSPDYPYGWCTDSEEYDLKEIEDHSMLRGVFMVEPVALINEYFAGLIHFGVTQGISNIGFDPIRARAMEDTLSTYAVGIVGAGFEARYGYGFLGVNFDMHFHTDDAIGNVPVVTINTGLRIPGREERRRAAMPEPEPVPTIGPAPAPERAPVPSKP